MQQHAHSLSALEAQASMHVLELHRQLAERCSGRNSALRWCCLRPGDAGATSSACKRSGYSQPCRRLRRRRAFASLSAERAWLRYGPDVLVTSHLSVIPVEISVLV